MRRHVIKDIVLALLPLLLFLAYAYPAYSLKTRSAFTYDYTSLELFHLIVPIIVGAILCAVWIYAWKNRASTVFICLFCGAFLMNAFFVLCQLGVFNALGGTRWQMVLAGGVDGVDLAGIIDGVYIVMFWVSLVSYIKAKKENRAG